MKILFEPQFKRMADGSYTPVCITSSGYSKSIGWYEQSWKVPVIHQMRAAKICAEFDKPGQAAALSSALHKLMKQHPGTYKGLPK